MCGGGGRFAGSQLIGILIQIIIFVHVKSLIIRISVVYVGRLSVRLEVFMVGGRSRKTYNPNERDGIK